MVGFGASLLGSQLLIMVQSQSDILIGGRMLIPHELGLYSEALFLTQIFVSRFIPPLNDVAFPAYARMQADKSMLNHSFFKAVRSAEHTSELKSLMRSSYAVLFLKNK